MPTGRHLETGHGRQAPHPPGVQSCPIMTAGLQQASILPQLASRGTPPTG